MRIYKKFLIAILCGGAVFIFGLRTGLAEEDLNLRKEGGNYLVSIAKTAYARGQYEDAAHEFSKALLVDPENKEALEGLRAMGIDRGLYADVRTSLTNTVEISRNFKLQEVAEQTILNESAKRRKVQFLDVEPKQDELGNVNKKIEQEIKALQKDIETSRQVVAQADVPQAIKKAEKSIEKADMTLAEGLLASPQTMFEQVGTEQLLGQQKIENPVLAQNKENAKVQIKETIFLPVDTKNSDVLRPAARKVELALTETMQKPGEEKNLNILMVPEEKTKLQQQQIALAYDKQVKQKGKNSDELFSNQEHEIENVSVFEERIEKSAQDALAYDKDLKAILAEQNRMRQELFEQEEYNRKMFAVLEDYLYAHRDFTKDAITQKIMAEMDLASAQSALLDRHDELNRLYKDLDYYLARNYQKDDVIEEKNEDIMYLRNQIRNNPDTRLLWEKLEESQKNIIEKKQKIKELEERAHTITVQ